MELSLESYEEQKKVSQNREMSMVAVESERAVQEVQAALVIAKRFPRDTQEAFNRIMDACQRKNLAEDAEYSYPRGGTSVTGPSIRLAEVLAQNWGNMDFGIKELSQGGKASEIMAYAWDLETNTKQVKVFTVPHTRYSKKKGNTLLTDPRDIYEMTANQGARRLRACILGIIPGDVVDEAVKACRQTVKKANAGLPLKDRVRNLMLAFDRRGITADMVERRLAHGISLVTEEEYEDLRTIGVSIKDNMSKREDWFEMGGVTSGLKDKLDGVEQPFVTGEEFLLLIRGMRGQLEGYVMANIDQIAGYDPKVKKKIATSWLKNKGFDTPLPECLAEFGPKPVVEPEEKTDKLVDEKDIDLSEESDSINEILDAEDNDPNTGSMTLEMFEDQVQGFDQSIGEEKMGEIMRHISCDYETGETAMPTEIHSEDYESVLLMADQQFMVMQKAEADAGGTDAEEA